MRTCGACGTSNGPEDDFCGNCGAYLGWSDTPPAPEAAESAPPPADEFTPAVGRPPGDEAGPGAGETPLTGEVRAGTVHGQSAPRPPTEPAPGASRPEAVAPVRPAKPVSARPVVRPAAVPDETVGAPCPVCGTPNLPDRRFCRRCATVLRPAGKPAPLPWWRTVWPFRHRVRTGSGRAARFGVILAGAVALCVGAFLLLPAGRAVLEDTRDKLGTAKPVTPVKIKASAETPRHPATNTTDGLNNRYWGAPAPGASVTYTFRKPFRLVDLIITNGASTSPEDYAGQARALRMDLEVTTQDGTKHHREITLSDKPGDQTIPTGISDVTTVRLVLRSPAGLTAGRQLALAEVEFFRRG